ncbi:hypothetical protein JCM24511_06779 [Saitozyma sp. JCM 24511]|nr:hypothetical protein JCM24511_06779 [Saitozyma sp. JCM 24511]
MASASPEAILHLATLHLLAQAGFASTSRAASLTLSTATEKYLRLVASACTERAGLAGRNKVAAGDVLATLEDLGEGVESLWEWVVDQPVVLFEGGTDGLQEHLDEGRGVEEALAEMRLVPETTDDDESMEEASEDEEDLEADTDRMDIDADADVKPHLQIELKPDPSTWLPPLPGEYAPAPDIVLPQSHQAAPTSTADKYRRAIPFAGSLLSSKPFEDPPTPSSPVLLPPPTSSFPSLLGTYQAIASEPSVSLRQTDLRRQATEILRRSVASAEQFSPSDTLIFPLPGPRVSPIIPSHSDTQTTSHLLPVNPDRSGMLSSLVHQMHSPHLPPKLRERLTSLRPPLPQTRNGAKDGEPIFYGDPVRGPDQAALNKAKGKPTDPSEERFLRYTWDTGPRGADKFGKGKLPTGKKVVKSGQGENVPREPETTRTLKFRLGDATSPAGPSGSPGATSPATPGIRLKLGKRDSTEGVPPAPAASAPAASQGGPAGLSAPPASDGAPTSTSVAVPTPTAASVAPAAPTAATTLAPPAPRVSLKLSLSPTPSSTSPTPPT